MQPERAPKALPASDRSIDRELDRRLRYSGFKSVCAMLEAGCTPEQLELLSRQRAALEKKLGYEAYRLEDDALPTLVDPWEEAENRADELEFRRRMRAVLQRKRQPLPRRFPI